MYTPWKEFVQANCDFLDKNIDPAKMSKRLNEIAQSMLDTFQESMDENLLRLFMLIVLEACIPIDSAIPVYESIRGFCLHDSSSTSATAADMMTRLATQMGGSVLCQKQNKPKQKSDKQPAKRRKVSSGRDAVSAMVMDEGGKEHENTVTVDGKEVPKLFLHDVAAIIASPLRQVPQEKWKMRDIERIVRTAFQFCLCGSIDLNGRTTTTWSKLREELKVDVVKTHLAQIYEASENLKQQLADSNDTCSQTEEDEVTMVLRELGASGDEPGSDAQWHCPLNPELADMLDDQAFMLAVYQGLAWAT